MKRPNSADAYIEKAERALDSARVLMTDGDAVGACNRAYYAMFYAAHAALWAAGAHPMGAIIKTHSGLVSLFGEKLVVTDRMGSEYGRALARVQQTRLLADYTSEPPTEKEAETSLRLAETFVAAMRLGVERPTPSADR